MTKDAIKETLRKTLVELEAADIIIDQFDELAKEHHIDRSFTLRRAPRDRIIGEAHGTLKRPKIDCSIITGSGEHHFKG